VCVLLHVKLSSTVKMFIMRLSPFLPPSLSASLFLSPYWEGKGFPESLKQPS